PDRRSVPSDGRRARRAGGARRSRGGRRANSRMLLGGRDLPLARPTPAGRVGAGWLRSGPFGRGLLSSRAGCCAPAVRTLTRAARGGLAVTPVAGRRPRRGGARVPRAHIRVVLGRPGD